MYSLYLIIFPSLYMYLRVVNGNSYFGVNLYVCAMHFSEKENGEREGGGGAQKLAVAS